MDATSLFIIVQHHFHCLNLWPLCQGKNNNVFILITGSCKVTNWTNFVEILTNTKVRPRLSHFRLILGNQGCLFLVFYFFFGLFFKTGLRVLFQTNTFKLVCLFTVCMVISTHSPLNRPINRPCRSTSLLPFVMSSVVMFQGIFVC